MTGCRNDATYELDSRLELSRVSVIIAAYNEQAFIEETVRSVLGSGFPCELIVVNDGSTDATGRILAKYSTRARIITHSVNRGKAAAVATGLRAASGDIVVLCDAHLRGLCRYHLLTLVQPLSHGRAREVMGLGIPAGLFLVRAFLPDLILTGQRAYFRDDLLPLAEAFDGLGYGLEAFLFTCFRREDKTVVLLPGLVHLLKLDTSRFVAALVSYFREAAEILSSIIRMRCPELAQVLRRARVTAQRLLGSARGGGVGT